MTEHPHKSHKPSRKQNWHDTPSPVYHPRVERIYNLMGYTAVLVSFVVLVYLMSGCQTSQPHWDSKQLEKALEREGAI